MLSEGIYNILSTATALTALLGTARTDGTTGIFNMLAPDEVTIPYVVFAQEGAEPVIAFEGANRLQRAVMRFACYASSAKVVKQVANQVKYALNGLFQTNVAGNVTFEGAWLEREVDLVESVPHGTIYSTHVDYTMWWTDNA